MARRSMVLVILVRNLSYSVIGCDYRRKTLPLKEMDGGKEKWTASG